MSNLTIDWENNQLHIIDGGWHTCNISSKEAYAIDADEINAADVMFDGREVW